MSEFGDIDPGLKVSNILAGAPFMIVYGPPKAGKSTDVALALNNCLFFTHDDQVLRPYASYYRWLETNFPDKIHELQLRHPSKPWAEGGMAIKEFAQFTAGADFTRIRQNTADAIRSWLETKYCPEMKKGNWPFAGLVFDEWSTFCLRIFDDMGRKYFRETSRYGEVSRSPDHFTISPKLKEFHTELAQIAQYTGAPLTLVSHERTPSYYDPKFDAGKNPDEIKYQGGPAFPHGALISQCCAAASLVLRLKVTDAAEEAKGKGALDLAPPPAAIPGIPGVVAPAAPAVEVAPKSDPWSPDAANGSKLIREYITEVSEEWIGGIRDFRINSREKLDLRGVLLRSEFPIR